MIEQDSYDRAFQDYWEREYEEYLALGEKMSKQVEWECAVFEIERYGATMENARAAAEAIARMEKAKEDDLDVNPHKVLRVETEPLTHEEAKVFLAVCGHTTHEFEDCLDWKLNIEDGGVLVVSLDEKHKVEFPSKESALLILTERIHEHRAWAELEAARVVELEAERNAALSEIGVQLDITASREDRIAELEGALRLSADTTGDPMVCAMAESLGVFPLEEGVKDD